MEMLIIAIVGVVAFAIVLMPLFRRGTRPQDAREFETGREDAPVPRVAEEPPVAPDVPDVAPDESPTPAPHDELELEVQRYRAALRAGTICSRCGQANPADSRFCFECGAQLPLAEAQEFE